MPNTCPAALGGAGPCSLGRLARAGIEQRPLGAHVGEAVPDERDEDDVCRRIVDEVARVRAAEVDASLPEEDVRQAEANVAAWREEGKLPFPNLPGSVRTEVWNTLDWPPRGSAATEGG